MISIRSAKRTFSIGTFRKSNFCVEAGRSKLIVHKWLNYGFLAFEYSGHGKSSGKFTKGNISLWTHDTRIIIKKIVKKNNFILVCSSMGSWIGLNQFKYFKKQIKGFIGIGSAPEFLEQIMWKKFTKKMKRETRGK